MAQGARVRRWLVVLVGCVLLLGACNPGGGSDEPGQAGGDESTAEGDAERGSTEQERSGKGTTGGNRAWFRTGEGRLMARYAGEISFIPVGGDVDVTRFALDVEGQPTEAVCVEKLQWLQPDQPHAARSVEEVGLEGAGRAAFIVKNHRAMGSPLGDDDEGAALQLAVWTAVGDLTVDDIPEGPIRDRTAELLARSEGESSPFGPTRIEVVVEPVDGRAAVLVRVLADGAGMAEQDVDVRGPGVQRRVRTGADGTVEVALDRPGEVEATWAGTVPAGTVFEPADEDGQALMTVRPVEITRSGRFTLPGAAPPAAA